MKWMFFLAALLVMLASCATPPPTATVVTQPAVAPASVDPPSSNLPNPASAFCEQQGYVLKIRTAADGSQAGFCVFPDGSECDEWAYYRGECKPVVIEQTPTAHAPESQDWATYTNELLGYSFQYPAGIEITINDDPLKSLSLSGTGMGDESWGISHPTDREDYRPLDGVDLVQWLTDHNLLGEKRMLDEQIAGTTAVHLRHERSPQSFAFDRFYLIHSGQLFMVTIGHSSDQEDWELNNRFLQSFQFEKDSSSAFSVETFPTLVPITTQEYQGWWTYTHADYNFSIMLPEDWVVEEVTGSDPLMNGHELWLHPTYADRKNIRMTFRQVGDDAFLWPTGVGQGEFIPQDTLEVAGEPARRLLLVCPSGEVTAIWYHGAVDQPNIVRGDLEFGFIFTAASHCETGYSLSGKNQRVGEMIIASLKVP